MESLNPSKDNTLYESSTGDLSNGSGAHIFAGNTAGGDIRRGLLAFDIAGAIPAGSTIQQVTLTLRMSRTAGGATNVQLHRASNSWGEGSSVAGGNEGGGGSARTGDATWIHRSFNTQLWDNIGGDFSSTVSASTSVSGFGTYTWGSTSQMVADVQSWLDNPSTAFGWFLIGQESGTQTAKRFDSRESSTAGNRPVLTVTYRAP